MTAALLTPKLRDDVPDGQRPWRSLSGKDADGRLLLAKDESEGPARHGASKVGALAAQMREKLPEQGELRSGALAKAISTKRNATFERARQLALDEKWTQKVDGKHGFHVAGAFEEVDA